MAYGAIVPFTGRMSYCYSKCLAMMLAYKGETHPLPFLECLTTVPFGFMYIREERGGFAVNGYNPHKGVERALDALQYEKEFKWFRFSENAEAYLRFALESGPVLIGPVDMGYLVYDPYSKFKMGADHYIIATRLEDGHLIVNDPEGYVQVPIPMSDFLKAWRAHSIRYKEGPYSLWIIGRKRGRPSIEDMYKRSLQYGLQNLKAKRELHARGRIIGYAGAEAIRKLAEDIRRYRSSRWLRFYATLTFRVSDQRCFDSSMFIRDAPFQNEPLVKASEVRMEQAKLYGKAQLYSAIKRFSKVYESLLEIARMEDEFEEYLEKGLSEL